MMNIALFGPPGAGKGTQSKLLIEKYNLVYIATGEILREEITSGTELGKKAKDIIEAGGLVSDELIVRIIEKKIQNNTQASGFLFDGFPRTLVQAYILEGLLLKLNATLNCMISLEVPEDELIKRLLDRSKKEGRKDDTLDVIKVRLTEYWEKTAPVADFYKERNKYYALNGKGQIEDVHKRITDTIEEVLQQVWLNVVLLGPPGSGKGTQGKMLAEYYNLYYISTGSKLRKEVKNNTDIGKKAKPYLAKGNLVPDEIIIHLIETEIKKHNSVRGFVFKGFPRTIVQAYILDGMLRRLNSTVSHALALEVPTLNLMKRLAARGRTDHARSYDLSTELIVHRLEEYEEKTAPVLDYYQKTNKLLMAEGTGDENVVHQKLIEAVERAFRVR
ncbi:MAG: adenylate kinase [Bacteroidales bacterium]|nr:adenylate kinase [Bacteroidales bacterium]